MLLGREGLRQLTHVDVGRRGGAPSVQQSEENDRQLLVHRVLRQRH